jgi:hypothetical protein
MKIKYKTSGSWTPVGIAPLKNQHDQRGKSLGRQRSFLERGALTSSNTWTKISDFILEISDDDNQCKISVRTTGIARTAQPVPVCGSARDFAPDPLEKRQYIPTRTETITKIRSTVYVAEFPDPEDSQNPLSCAADLVETGFGAFHRRIRDGSISTRFGAVHHLIWVGSGPGSGSVCSIEPRFGSSRFCLLAARWSDSVSLGPLRPFLRILTRPRARFLDGVLGAGDRALRLAVKGEERALRNRPVTRAAARLL